MITPSHKLGLGSALVLLCGFGSPSLRGVPVIPSPNNDILLSTAGGVADINGSTVDGSANYMNLPPANLNDGERDGFYNNGLGVDSTGSLAHTAGGGAGQEMGVTIPSTAFITSVDLFNRTDCCGYRIDGTDKPFPYVPFTLNIYNGATLTFTFKYTFTPTISLSGFNPHTANTETASGMVIPVGKYGTYVQIVQNNNDFMNLAELEAYTPEPASLSLLGLGALGLLTRRR